MLHAAVVEAPPGGCRPQRSAAAAAQVYGMSQLLADEAGDATESLTRQASNVLLLS